MTPSPRSRRRCNEPVRSFAPGSGERTALEAKLKELAAERAELTMTIGGEQRLGGGRTIDVVQPHHKDEVLGTMANATTDDVAGRARGGTGGRPGLAADVL